MVRLGRQILCSACPFLVPPSASKYLKESGWGSCLPFSSRVKYSPMRRLLGLTCAHVRSWAGTFCEETACGLPAWFWLAKQQQLGLVALFFTPGCTSLPAVPCG
ncbi:hypothetical protein E2320_018820, partial [Naja naja]